MAAALALARRGLGRVWPNPAVGCVLVRDGHVVGRGWTQPGGRPHAETEALRRAGASARDAAAYITLEPCAHHGLTPPCAQALVSAGIARAVVATVDPDPRTAGRGIEDLRSSGVEVSVGVGESPARDLNRGFFTRISAGRPMFTLKMATTLDGRIASRTGDSRWITGEAARRRGHWLRASHDAILVGSETALVDDPSLTCRLPGLDDRSPIRIVADGRLRLEAGSVLASSARLLPLWVITRTDAGVAARRRALEAAGCEILEVGADDAGHPDPAAMAAALGAKGLTRVLIEGGGRLAASFLAAGLVDEVAWFRAPSIIGDDGRPAAAALGVDMVSAAPSFIRMGTAEVGADLMEMYSRSGS
ncbi:MAG: bifunctional diaminohydroxyphosphoribosylaminopyrimidine deaminase/5-amino-6-(5-phosphoribosylamino)uracil reductase RibD [Rhodospirillales bacterium]|nr:bifunctional diaminohydroxyphosphoribosylaminopyrimidine deaminase/5-amino-6-(5-phosphoribosylamino)uracil reductase RibD [Rhodospirillales bacterium]